MNFSFLNEIILTVVLGIVQGITEFLPISSTAHLRIASSILTQGRDVGLMSSNILQFGTILAVIVYFWKDLHSYFARTVEVIKSQTSWHKFWGHAIFWWNYPPIEEISKNPELDQHLLEIEKDKDFATDIAISQIVVGTLPILVVGALLYGFSSENSNRTLEGIATFLLIGSILMGLAEWAYTKSKSYEKTRIISKGEVILIGLFQSLAIFPGISRSGATISGALFLGRDRKDSVRFSFLLSIPAILIAGSLDFFKFIREIIATKSEFILPQARNWTDKEVSLSLLSVGIGVLFAFIFGLLFLKWLIKYLGNHTFKWFIVYRVVLAVSLIITIWLGYIS